MVGLVFLDVQIWVFFTSWRYNFTSLKFGCILLHTKIASFLSNSVLHGRDQQCNYMYS